MTEAASAEGRPRSRVLGTPGIAVFGLGSLLLAVAVVVHLQQGVADVPLPAVVEALVAYQGTPNHAIVRHGRLPRTAAGLVAGALLAVSGLLLQTATRNPLAAPATLGVNAGAFLAVVAGAALLPGLHAATPISLAFAGGLAAALVALVVAGGLSASPVRLALAGMAVAMALSSAAAALQILYQQATAGLFFWGSGTLIQDGWGRVTYALLRGGPGLAAALLLARPLDVLALGDETARGLGQRVDLVRVGSATLAVFLAAAAISVAGPVGFVGLVAPHLVRLAGLRRHLPRILGAALWGSLLLVAADVLGRVLAPRLAEIPVGVVTALVGAPLLVVLARRVGRGPDEGGRPGDAGGSGPSTTRRLPVAATLLAAAAALGAAVLAGVGLGAVGIPPGVVLDVLQGGGSPEQRHIVLGLRLPRILAAALAGGCVAASGLLIQGVVRNPLAAPDLVGVMSGAGVGAMLLLVAFPGAPASLLPLAAFAGAVLSFAVVYAGAWKEGVSPERLVLMGIGVAAVGESLIHVLVVQSDLRLAQALVWLAGSTYAQGWGDVQGLALWAALLLPLSWVAARHLDLLGVGDAAAAGLGVPVERARLLNLGLAVALAAVAVATVGTVGFVGLVAPHAARLLVGGAHRRLLPLAVLLGALALVAADLAGRVLIAPAQLPSGLVAAMLGAPYFVWLLRRERRAA